MPTNNLNELFQHELGDIYDAEQQILSSLNEMETETKNTQIRDRVRRHRDETQQQIQNLEQCFELMGVSAPSVECSAIRGLRDEKKTFKNEQPSPEALEVYNLDATNKTEHYEVASYRSLMDQAKTLGQDDIHKLLEQNCQQEIEMSQWVEKHQPDILKEWQAKS